jgi:hypothetical protein
MVQKRLLKKQSFHMQKDPLRRFVSINASRETQTCQPSITLCEQPPTRFLDTGESLHDKGQAIYDKLKRQEIR